MRITLCDNCEKELIKEKEAIALSTPTIYTITKKEKNNPNTHRMMGLNEESDFIKHFCSKDCISNFYK